MSVDKREQLRELMKKYVDENNTFDATTFRRENPNEYALLSHYFGGINNAVERFGWIKVVKNKSEKGDAPILRDQLALNMLKLLRQKRTLDQIGSDFGVTRAAISQLYKSLEKSVDIKEEVKKENK
jgi:truncated hemoglobin YjbI